MLGRLAESAGESEVQELVSWALPIQERHFTQTKDRTLELAAAEDPNEAA